MRLDKLHIKGVALNQMPDQFGTIQNKSNLNFSFSLTFYLNHHVILKQWKKYHAIGFFITLGWKCYHLVFWWFFKSIINLDISIIKNSKLPKGQSLMRWNKDNPCSIIVMFLCIFWTLEYRYPGILVSSGYTFYTHLIIFSLWTVAKCTLSFFQHQQ